MPPLFEVVTNEEALLIALSGLCDFAENRAEDYKPIEWPQLAPLACVRLSLNLLGSLGAGSGSLSLLTCIFEDAAVNIALLRFCDEASLYGPLDAASLACPMPTPRRLSRLFLLLNMDGELGGML